jgi:uncharacterized protein (TIGR02996 family)
MSTALSDEDRAFLRAILNNPAELTAWLAYLDWLDEHNDLRAEYIRLELRRGQIPEDDPERTEIVFSLRELRKRLDPDRVAIFDRPEIEGCDEAFKFKCPKQWTSLAATDDPKVRHCDKCNKQVHYCGTIAEARELAQEGSCVAVSLAVLRYPDDLDEDELTNSVSDDIELDDVMGLFDPNYKPPPRRPWWKFW